MPQEVAENFKQRFVQSLRFWGRTGRGLHSSIIEDLRQHGIPFAINGTTNHGKNRLQRVRIKRVQDDLDVLRCSNSTVTSWKRFAITILKNDHTCKYMGLAPTKEQAERQRAIVEKYKKL